MKYFKHQMLSAILEEIRMKDGESFDDFYVKLNDIVNSSFNIGERILEMKIVKNVLKSLLERFKPKATVINKSKDLNMIKLVELDGSLQTDELTISYSKKNKSVALNTIREENYDTTDTDAFNDEVVAYFVQKFKKVFKNKRKVFKNKRIPRINTKVALVNSGRIIERRKILWLSRRSLNPLDVMCQGFGYIRSEYPSYKKTLGKGNVEYVSH